MNNYSVIKVSKCQPVPSCFGAIRVRVICAYGKKG